MIRFQLRDPRGCLTGDFLASQAPRAGGPPSSWFSSAARIGLLIPWACPRPGFSQTAFRNWLDTVCARLRLPAVPALPVSGLLSFKHPLPPLSETKLTDQRRCPCFYVTGCDSVPLSSHCTSVTVESCAAKIWSNALRSATRAAGSSTPIAGLPPRARFVHQIGNHAGHKRLILGQTGRSDFLHKERLKIPLPMLRAQNFSRTLSLPTQ